MSVTAIANWKPTPSEGLKCSDNEYGYPTVVYRTPSRLVEECKTPSTKGYCSLP